MQISGSTKVIGFVGSSYAKSRMYGIYNAIFQTLDIDWVYVPLRVTDIAGAIQAMRALGIHAVGVTIPFKVSVIEHLDAIDDSARRAGAVNAVVLRDGRLIGSNTDGQGALRAIEEVTAVAGRTICLLGGGGAARAIAVELIGAGAQVNILSIDAAEAQSAASATGATAIPWKHLAGQVAAADILVNAPPLGMAGTAMVDESLVPEALFRPGQIVMDVIATPAETRLLREAKTRGLTTVSGERMLLRQALLKFRFFTGHDVTMAQLEAAMRQAERA